MPNETLPESVSQKEMDTRAEKARIEVETGRRNAEWMRLSQPATVRMVNDVLARLYGIHWQL